MRPPSPRVVAVALATAAVIALLAVGIVVASSSEPAATGAGELPPGVVATAAEPAPVLEGRDPITGEQVRLSDFAGKPVVVNVWASWCPGCNDEAEDLRRLAEEHPEAVVLGIDLADSEEGARAFYERWRWEHPSIADPSGELSARLGLQGMPSTFFLDAEHRIVARVVGVTDLRGFEAGLELAARSR